jgi:hypothetical protein
LPGLPFPVLPWPGQRVWLTLPAVGPPPAGARRAEVRRIGWSPEIRRMKNHRTLAHSSVGRPTVAAKDSAKAAGRTSESRGATGCANRSWMRAPRAPAARPPSRPTSPTTRARYGHRHGDRCVRHRHRHHHRRRPAEVREAACHDRSGSVPLGWTANQWARRPGRAPRRWAAVRQAAGVAATAMTGAAVAVAAVRRGGIHAGPAGRLAAVPATSEPPTAVAGRDRGSRAGEVRRRAVPGPAPVCGTEPASVPEAARAVAPPDRVGSVVAGHPVWGWPRA